MSREHGKQHKSSCLVHTQIHSHAWQRQPNHTWVPTTNKNGEMRGNKKSHLTIQSIARCEHARNNVFFGYHIPQNTICRFYAAAGVWFLALFLRLQKRGSKTQLQAFRRFQCATIRFEFHWNPKLNTKLLIAPLSPTPMPYRWHFPFDFARRRQIWRWVCIFYLLYIQTITKFNICLSRLKMMLRLACVGCGSGWRILPHHHHLSTQKGVHNKRMLPKATERSPFLRICARLMAHKIQPLIWQEAVKWFP